VDLVPQDLVDAIVTWSGHIPDSQLVQAVIGLAPAIGRRPAPISSASLYRWSELRMSAMEGKAQL
jgi:hypothetical protein